MPFGLQHTIKVPSNPLPQGAAYSAAAQVTLRGEVALMSDPAALSLSGSTWGESTQGQSDNFAW
jgi:hypothetical protein